MISRPTHSLRLARLERWSARATLIILLGIVIETALLFWFPPAHVLETAATASAHVLIGVGLAAEYVVILRASATHKAADGADVEDQALESRAQVPSPESHRSEELRPPRPVLRAVHRRRLGGFVVATSEAAKHPGCPVD